MITVKDLIKKLQELDPDLPIGVLHDVGVVSADEIGVYEGQFRNGDGHKMIYQLENRKFLIIGNPGDYDAPCYHDYCKPLEVFYFFNGDGEWANDNEL